jgi:hypothetical protein
MEKTTQALEILDHYIAELDYFIIQEKDYPLHPHFSRGRASALSLAKQIFEDRLDLVRDVLAKN